MRTWQRWLAGLAGVVLLALIGVFAASEGVARGREHPPLIEIKAATDPGAVARGRQLAALYGCSGCHGDNLQGHEWANEPLMGSVYTSNLTRALPAYSDAELARAVRAGVRPDGSMLWSMPSESWIAVTDAEMADLIAFLRTYKPAGEPQPRARFGPLGRVALLTGEIEPTTRWVERAHAKPPFDAGAVFARGRHLASTVCSECHRSDLKGTPGDTPDLTIAASYDLDGFTRLMRTGVAADGKERGLMTEVAKSRFSHFTEQDIADLHGYLVARAERME